MTIGAVMRKRSEGLGYRVIARMLNLPIETVRELTASALISMELNGRTYWALAVELGAGGTEVPEGKWEQLLEPVLALVEQVRRRSDGELSEDDFRVLNMITGGCWLTRHRLSRPQLGGRWDFMLVTNPKEVANGP